MPPRSRSLESQWCFATSAADRPARLGFNRMQAALIVAAVSQLASSVAPDAARAAADRQARARAVALQQAVNEARPGSTIELSGTYNFSTSSFLIEGKTDLTLKSTGTPVALFVFGYTSPHSDETTGSVQPGVNITNSQRVSIFGATIDYSPKSAALFCNSRAPGAGAPTGKVALVHGNASINEMLDNQRLWCGRKPGDKCMFGSFDCPSAAACHSRESTESRLSPSSGGHGACKQCCTVRCLAKRDEPIPSGLRAFSNLSVKSPL